MRQAITTKYHGPTDRSGARIIARAAAGRAIRPYDHAMTVSENHTAAAETLARKMGWSGVWVGGGGGPSEGCVYVMVPDDIAKGWLGAGGPDRFFVARA